MALEPPLNPPFDLRYPLDATYSPSFVEGESIVAVFHNSAARQLKTPHYWIVSSLLLAASQVSLWLTGFWGSPPFNLALGENVVLFLIGIGLLFPFLVSLVRPLAILGLVFEFRSEEALFTTHHLFVARKGALALIPIEAIARLKAWISARDARLYEGILLSFHEHLVTMPFGFKHHYQMLNVPRDFPALPVLRAKGVVFAEVQVSRKEARPPPIFPSLP